MYADSGADVNVAPHTWYRKEMGILQPCTLTLSPYGTEEQIPVEAKFKTTITTEKGAQKETWIHLVKADQHFQPLLGDIDATALGFLTFKPEGRELDLAMTSLALACSFLASSVFRLFRSRV